MEYRRCEWGLRQKHLYLHSPGPHREIVLARSAIQRAGYRIREGVGCVANTEDH